MDLPPIITTMPLKRIRRMGHIKGRIALSHYELASDL
jgi:hypothetical protein